MVPEQEVVYGGVAANVRVLQAVAREPTRQEARDGALYAVLLAPVHQLVSDPEQGAVAGTLYVARAVEEHDVVFAARLADSLAVYPGPLLGVAVVVRVRVCAGEQHRVVGKALPEVCHPPRGPVADQLLFDQVLDPASRSRVREVHETRREVGNLDPVRLTVAILDQVATLRGLPKEVSAMALPEPHAVADEGVDVGHEPDVLTFQALHERVPVRVVVPVQLPIPPQLGAEAGLPLAHPILQPDGGDGSIEGLESLEYLAYPVRAALQSNHGSVHDPPGQRAHPSGVLGVLFDQTRRRVRRRDLTPHPRSENAELNPILLAEVEGRVFVVLQEQGTRLARYVVRHAGVAGVGVAAGACLPVGGLGHGLLAPAYALFPDEDGNDASLHVEVRELGPEAEEALLRRRGVGEIDPVAGLPYLGLESEPPVANGRKGKRIVDALGIIRADEPAGDQQPVVALLDTVYGLVGMRVGNFVFHGDVRPLLPDGLFALGGGEETHPGNGAPEHPFRPEAVDDVEVDLRGIPARLQQDVERADAIGGRRDIARHPGDGAGELSLFSPERTGPAEQRRSGHANSGEPQEPPARQRSLQSRLFQS